MVDSVTSRFASLVGEVALEEELLLRQAAGEGIFFMPELAFAFAVGRSTALRSEAIFGESGWQWVRERREYGLGPVDLQFERGDDGPRLFVEFKMRDTADAYQRDIDKLQTLAAKRENDADVYLFCALLDVWVDSPFSDPRLLQLGSDDGNHIAALFKTKQNRYERPIACAVGIWDVNV